MDLISASIIALIFGLTTALSFCAIHPLSTVAIFSIGSKKDPKFYPSLIALGHFSAIALVGLMVIFIASLVKEYLIYLQIPAILFILIIGIYLLIGRKSNGCHEECSSCAKKNNLVNQNYLQALIFGFSIGLLCVSAVFPLAGTVLLAPKLSELQMAILLAFYAIGHSLPILLVAYIPFLTQKFIKKEIPESKFLVIKKIAGLFLIAMSLFFFYDIIIKGDDHHYDYDIMIKGDDHYYDHHYYHKKVEISSKI